MENASKALIIAGAILISILIVGLGVIIYNNVSGIASDTSGIDQQAVSSHNSPIESYFSDHTTGSNVRALINYVNGINRTAQANSDTVGNYIYLTTTDTNIASSGSQVTTSNIRTGRSYSVHLGGDGSYSDTNSDDDASYWSNGYIKKIVIEFADDSTT